ncbi:MAG: hypothetical protein LBQ66_01845, partial [Planctomycetaceae bacterium]|nr:hypothetical protein [Planctomycetaceae bacterium]
MWYNEGETPAFQSAPLRGDCRLRRRERETHRNFYRPKPKNADVVGARLALVPNGAGNVLEFLLAKKPH